MGAGLVLRSVLLVEADSLLSLPMSFVRCDLVDRKRLLHAYEALS